MLCGQYHCRIISLISRHIDIDICMEIDIYIDIDMCIEFDTSLSS